MINFNFFKLHPSKVLIAILLLTVFLRLFRLDYPENYVFDEVYHAFTAKEYVKGNKSTWDPWATPPAGVAYEWTHPPLAKEIMAISMKITGSDSAWAWRLPGAVLGVLSVYLVYLLGLRLTKSETASLIASFLFSIDGLNFVQSRVGMNDVYFVTFILTSLLFLLNKRFFLSSVFFGLAISSKWASIYFILILAPILLLQKDWVKLVYFLLIPPIIYLLSYLPYFLSGYDFPQFIELQKQMWWYHTNLKATHDYSSAWWSWPFNLYPVWYFVDYQKDKIANIFASGNPVLFWIGSLSILLTIWQAVKQKSVNLFIIILGFIAFWLPWSFSPRIMFLYHFSPSVPFLALSLGYQLNKGLENKQIKELVIVLLGIIFLSFILMLPFLTGIPLPKEIINLFFASNLTKNPF